jgi:hypothetical protein
MPDIDDRLQNYISQIEAGVPKEQVLSSLREGEQELAALIKLADAMRTISHPMPAPAYARATKQMIITAVPKPITKRPSNGKFQLGWLLFPSLTGAVALLVIMFITFATLGIWLAGPASADIALAADIEGVVEFSSSMDSTVWAILSGGESVRSGQYIRTSPGSSAVLVYTDGSRTRIGPETSLQLIKIDGSWSGAIQVKMEQLLGQTVHEVVPLNGQDAYYTVVTPSGEASVHGTTFKVSVESNGVSRVIVEDGAVMVKGATDELVIPQGQATLLQPGAPQEMGNFFSIVDIIESIQGNAWSISGQTLQVSNRTYIAGAPTVGQVFQIEGRILENGLWMADKISPLQEEFRSSFTGLVEAITDDIWTISGKSVIVNDSTQVEGSVGIGVSVDVEYYALNSGNWFALQIVGLGEEALVQPATPPTESGAENENRAVSCQQDQTQTEATHLSELYGVSYEEIMVWYCSSYDFSEIDLAYSLSEFSAQPVYVIFNLNKTMTWSEINAYLAQFQLMYQPGSINCMPAAYLPKAEQLAYKYGVPIEEVINLFCQGNSFSTIDLTLKLAQEYGITSEEILEKKNKGVSWGQIMKELHAKNAGKPDKEDQPGKDNHPDKPDKPDKPDTPAEGAPPPGQAEKDEVTE